MKRVNNFLALKSLRKDYRSYVSTFQKYRNPRIAEWVGTRIETGTLLWQEPLVELNRRFKTGKSISDFVSEEFLDEKISDMFVVNPNDPESQGIELYRHQSESISKVLEHEVNIVVTTGTGSGKSFCFGIPIISECLRMVAKGVKGVKAVLVYPMNALINSQYETFARILKDSGLKVAKYTGETKNSPEEARELLKKISDREPYDSEIVSREEIRSTPPDILMTNYVMLDLLLTRHEDKALFPSDGRSPLRFIVLDEIHTYTGHRGADVACLIRRLKSHTKSIGKIRCIGTSATVESLTAQDSKSVVANFASELFGEPFSPENVIEEYYQEPKPSGSIIPLTPQVNVTGEMIEQFDGSIETTVPLAEALIGRSLANYDLDPTNLGNLMKDHAATLFLRRQLQSRPLSLQELADTYQDELRKEKRIDDCRRELEAALLVGSVALGPEGEGLPLIVPKTHIFFSQGSLMYACLTSTELHLNQTGDQVCRECAPKIQSSPTFPLAFCRSCGQEFYGVSVQDDVSLRPRPLDADITGIQMYLTKVDDDNSELMLPDSWIDDKERVRKRYADAVPIKGKYCPVCNTLDPDCEHDQQVEVWKTPYPFLLCPTCGISYTRREREFSKLFEFSSIGRSTATDILGRSVLGVLPNDQRKLIVFSDNRQDTALQAAHMNDFYRRAMFRRTLNHTINELSQDGKRVKLKGLGKDLRETMRRFGTLPNYAPDKGKYSSDEDSTEDQYYEEFLEYLIVSELVYSPISNQLSLEEVGLLKVEYDGLDLMVKNPDEWKDVPELSHLDPDQLTDYLTGFLDIMRHRKAINHLIANNSMMRWSEWEKNLRRDALFELRLRHTSIHGFSDELSSNRRILHAYQRVSWDRAAERGILLRSWTERALGISESERAREITKFVFGLLSKEDIRYIVAQELKNKPSLYQVNSSKIRVSSVDNPEAQTCPKCGKVYHWKTLALCTNRRCPSLVDINYSNHFFRQLYTLDPSQSVQIEAREHSGQVSGDERQSFEERFKNSEDSLNVLVCTPTMELGIDIGDLSAILMRNVPPDPSRYAQRAGRAGRKAQSSVVATFCGTGRARGPHDQYFFRHPEKIVSGKIVPPRFLLNNREVIKRQMRAMILEMSGVRLPTKFEELVSIETDNLVLESEVVGQIEQVLTSRRNELIKQILEAFESEVEEFDWLNEPFVAGVVDRFLDDLDRVVDIWREEYRRLETERNEIHQQLAKKFEKRQAGHYAALAMKLERMRQGTDRFYTFTFLSAFGFLPSYGFPSVSSQLSLFDWQADSGGAHDIVRRKSIAIREFAPGNTIYFRGQRYQVSFAFPKTQDGRASTRYCKVCEECNSVLVDTPAELEGACPNCGAEFIDLPKTCLELPTMSAHRTSSITCEQEERARLGYSITNHYAPNSQNFKNLRATCSDDLEIEMTYEHNGRIVILNRGGRARRGGEITTTRGFYFCGACKRWLRGKDSVNKHLLRDGKDKCDKGAAEDDIVKDAWLFVEGFHDVVTIRVQNPDDVPVENLDVFYTSLKEAILQGLLLAFSLDDDEVDAFLTPIPGEDAQQIVLFETDEGGVGVLSSLLEKDVFSTIIMKSLDVIHVEDIESMRESADRCERSCYNCLLRYSNQMDHNLLDRIIIKPTLTQMMNCNFMHDSLDSGASLDSLIAECESQLERHTLEKIAEEGLPLPSQAQKTIYEGDEPITRTDFYYENKRLCVFVDGPPHDSERVSKQDQDKRKRIRGMGYRVIEMKGPEDVEKLRRYLGL